MSTAQDDVLVLDANGQAGLSIVRSLGQRELSVTAGSSHRRSLGGLSRFSDGSFVHPDPTESADRFTTRLLEHLRSNEYDAVVPVRDATTALLSAQKDAVEETDTTVAVEDWETFELTYDKGKLFEIAEPLSVPTPETFVPDSPDRIEEMADRVSYPAMVKPRSKTVWDGSGSCHYTEVDGGHYADAPDELVAAYHQILERNPVLEDEEHYPLVQEYVEGSTTTTVVLADEGEIRAAFQEERVRTYPSSGGNSTLLRALEDPSMRRYAEELVDALEWSGPAMVEFMRTPDDEFYLIEVNGRYWGSIPFAIESGVDFPWLHYRQLEGAPVDHPGSYRTDVLQHRLLNEDLKWLAEQLERGNLSAVPTFLWTCLRADQTFFAGTDPLPSIWAPGQTARLAASSAVRSLAAVGSGLDHPGDATDTS